MTDKRRLRLNDADLDKQGECILYVMSRDQRLDDNHALIAAQKNALEAGVPLVISFVIYEKTRHRSQEQYAFMLAGLEELAKKAKTLRIGFILRTGKPQKEIKTLVSELKPREVFFDLNPLRGPRVLQKRLAQELPLQCSVVDAHNIIPVWELSAKEEFAAHTIRKKVHKHLANWLNEPYKIQKHPYELQVLPRSDSFDKAHEVARKHHKSGVTYSFKSGETAARQALEEFVKVKLSYYAKDRNNPGVDGQSGLSPYLHFGQLSSLRVVLRVIEEAERDPLLLQEARLAQPSDTPTKMDSINTLLEEIIVRKELADNYCFFNENYDDFKGARGWAKDTLNAHTKDTRDFLYTQTQWEQSQAHDDAWNAAQKEMMKTGKMHGYMRMYWAKKILEWSKTPQEAIKTAIYLNDKYSLDGGDPNGHAGIMWAIAGVHDRPWPERGVYGKIRYMNARGLRRKFNLEDYIKRWS